MGQERLIRKLPGPRGRHGDQSQTHHGEPIERAPQHRPEDGERQGPRRPECTTHGLLSHQFLLHDEDHRAFEALADGLRSALQPQGALEQALVAQMAQSHWRRNRVAHLEAGVFESLRAETLYKQARKKVRSYEIRRITFMIESPHGTQETVPPPPKITNEIQHAAAAAEAAGAQARRETSIAVLGSAFVRGRNGSDTLLTLSRYDAMLARSYYQALHELQRLQLARRGEMVAPPVAIDVTMNGQDR